MDKAPVMYPDAPVMVPQDAAPAFLLVLLCAAVPKASAGFVPMRCQAVVRFGKPLRIYKPAEIFLILVIVLKAEAVYNP